MANEVVVDQKPMPKLPYDPNVIPPAVRKRAAAVDALYSSTSLTPPKVDTKPNGSDGSAAATPAPPPEKPELAHAVPPEPAPAPQVPVQPVSAPQAPAPASAEPHAPPPPDDENSPT